MNDQVPADEPKNDGHSWAITCRSLADHDAVVTRFTKELRQV